MAYPDPKFLISNLGLGSIIQSNTMAQSKWFWFWNFCFTKNMWPSKRTGLLSRKNWIFFIKSSFSGKNTFLKDLTLSNENSVKELPWIPINEGLNTKYLSPFFSWRCSSYSFSHFLTRDTRWGTFNILEYIVIWILLLTWDSMTSLLTHTVAQPTKWRFLPKNLS